MAKTHLLKTALAAAALAAAAGANANLLTNGSFESGIIPSPREIDGGANLPTGSTDISGWVVTSNAVDWLQSGTATNNSITAWALSAQDGVRFLDLAGFSENTHARIEQTFATTVGVAYDVSFYLGSTSGNAPSGPQLSVPGAITALISSANTGPTTSITAQTTNTAVNAWELRTFQFVATSASTTLAFEGTQGLNYIGLDNVTVTAVPEPGALALMLAGLAAVGSVVSRRRPQR